MSRHGASRRFFEALVRRPVLLLTLFVTCAVVGGISLDRIPVQMMPDGIVEPGLQVYVDNAGASAQENEEQVARVLEAELRTLPRIENIESNSRADGVGVFVEFRADTDMNFAKAEVRDRIERARPQLPATVQEIGIWSWNESDMPVLFFAIQHPGDSARTDFLVQNVIQRRIEAVDGVGKTEVWGLRDDSLRILLDEDRVRAAKLDLGALIRRLEADNFALPLGEVDDGGRRILLRSDMRFGSPEEIAAYPVGGGLTLGDIAEIAPVKTIQRSLFRIDGSYAYFGEVQKDGQANVVDTCKRLHATLAELEKDPALAGEFKFLVVFDQGEFIESSIAQLSDTALTGGLLAVLILFLFLWRVRLTLLVALSIPSSLLLAISWLYFTGRSFNVLAMTGITLAMGMLVDNAIVVVENITRVRALGLGKRESAVEGTSEVGLAILLSTLTTVVVFLPLIFMTENPTLRIIFGELGLPLCVALLASLLVALVFLPVSAERALGERSALAGKLARSLAPLTSVPARAVGGLFRLLAAIAGALGSALTAALRGACSLLAPVRWLLAAAILGFAAWSFVGSRSVYALLGALEAFRATPEPVPLGAQAWPILLAAAPAILAAILLAFGLPRWRRRLGEAAPREARIHAATEAGSPDSIVGFLVSTNERIARWTMEHRIAASVLAALAMASILIPVLDMEVTPFGQEESKSRINVYVDLEDNFTLQQASEEMEIYERFFAERREQFRYDHLACRFNERGARLSVFWDNPQTRKDITAVQRELRDRLPRLAGHKLRFIDEESRNEGPDRSIVTFRLHGPDSEELERLGTQGAKLLESVPGLTSVSTPLNSAPRQVRLRYDSDVAMRLGVDARTMLANVSWALRGVQLPRYQEPGREIPLIIEYDREQLAGLSTLRDLEIFTGQSAVPLASISDLEFGRASRSIERRNGKASFTIQARIEDPARVREISDAGQRALASLDLPRDYSVGEEDLASTRQEEEFAQLLFALLLSIVLVFLLMGILFESFLLPLSVLFTIPFAVLGAYWTLYLTGTAMDSVGWIGIIVLVGVVVNNGIVLIDRIHGLRGEGMERKAAVVEGSRNRVRPILMTALTTIIGLLPMSVTEPPGQGIDYRALATCVAGGLAFSSLFTLWVVPLAYTIIDDLAMALSERMSWAFRPIVRRDTAPVASPAPDPASGT